MKFDIRLLFATISSRFGKNLFWQIIANAITAIAGFVYSMSVAKYLGTADYGLMAATMAFSFTVFVIFDFRLHEPLIKFGTEYYETGDKSKFIGLIKLSFLTGLLCSFTGLIIVQIFAPFFVKSLTSEVEISTIVLLSSLICFVNASFTSTSIGILRILDDFKGFAIARLLGSLLNLSSFFILVFKTELDLELVLYQTLLVSFLSSMILIARVLSQLIKKVGSKYLYSPMSLVKEKYLEFFNFIKYTWGSQICAIPLKDLDVILAGSFGTLAEVGTYKIAKQFMSAVWMFTDPLLTVIYPELIKRRINGDIKEVKSFISKLIVGFFVTGLSVYLAALLLMPIIIESFFGAKYTGVNKYFSLLAWCVCVWMPLLWANPLLLASGKTKAVFNISIIVAVVSSGSYFLMGKIWGISGIALGYGIGVSVSSILSFLMCKKLKLF